LQVYSFFLEISAVQNIFSSSVFRYPHQKLSLSLGVWLLCQILSACQNGILAASLSDIAFQSRSLTLKSDQPISAPRWNVWDSTLGKEKTKLFVIDMPGIKELSPEGAQSARGVLKSNSAVKKLICRPASPGVMRVYFEVSADSIGQMAPVLKFKNNNEVTIQFQPITESQVGKIKLLPNATKPDANKVVVTPKTASPKAISNMTKTAAATKITNQPIYPAGNSLNTDNATTKGSSQGNTLTIKNEQGQFETVSMISLIERQSKKITSLEAQLSEIKAKEAAPLKPSANELAMQRQLTELSQDNDILKAQVQRLETELAVRDQREKLASQPAFTPQSPPEPVAMLNLASPIINQEPPAIAPPEVGQAVTLLPSAVPSAKPAISPQAQPVIKQPGITGQSSSTSPRERVVVIEQKAKEGSSGSSTEPNKIAQWLQSRKGKSPFSGLTISPQKMLNGVGPSAQFTLKRKKDSDTSSYASKDLAQQEANPEASFMTVMDQHPTDDPTIKALKASVKTQPNNPNAYYQIATAYKQKGELSKATDVLKTLVRSYPTQSKAYLELVDLNLATGKPLDAHVYLDEYKKLNGQDTQTITALQNRINLAMNSFIQTMEAQK
jgi:hypothetical protein